MSGELETAIRPALENAAGEIYWAAEYGRAIPDDCIKQVAEALTPAIETLLAEREREVREACAKVAEECENSDEYALGEGPTIAAAIRQTITDDPTDAAPERHLP